MKIATGQVGESVFTDALFGRFRELIYDQLGIHFSDGKKYIVHLKIEKFLNKWRFSSYEALYAELSKNRSGAYWEELHDEITTHKTDFFREINHFNFLRQKLDWVFSMNRRIDERGELRVWSAGCSTGEEAYTLAIVLSEILPKHVSPKILGTDISKEVLRKAMKGLYPNGIRAAVEGACLFTYFDRVGECYQIKQSIRKYVTFRLFNLMDPLPLKKPFDIIFCRNVMIYFDTKTQEALLEKFYNALRVGGLLFVGHSESLSHRRHHFSYIQPTIYLKHN